MRTIAVVSVLSVLSVLAQYRPVVRGERRTGAPLVARDDKTSPSTQREGADTGVRLDEMNPAIPADAVRGRTYPDRDGNDEIEYLYPKTKSVAAFEILSRQTHIRVALYAQTETKKRRVQWQWYDNGKPKSQEPREAGSMHGIYRYWDREGKLVGWYRMVHGTGIRRIYYANGRLHEETHYKDDVQDGPAYELYEGGQVEFFGEYRNGKATLALAFHENGSLAQVMPAEGVNGRRSGPCVSFFEDGRLKSVTYRVDTGSPTLNWVSRAEYLELCKADPTLPKLKNDPKEYKELVDERVQTIVKEYKAMRPVKIPLEFLEEGIVKP